MSERVVVTGVGAVSAVGRTAAECFGNLLEGRTGIALIDPPLDERYPSRLAAQVREIDDSRILSKKDAVRQARFTRLAAMAAGEATDAAGLRDAGYAPERIGCLLGVGLCGLEILERNAALLEAHGPERVAGLALPMLISNMAASMICQSLELRGLSACITTACASSAHAIGEAFDQLRLGRLDAVVCGGAEAAITPLSMAALGRMGAVSTRHRDPQAACRPFDKDRDGFVIGEGAGVLVLEREGAARRRGAPIRGVLLGYGASTDAFHPVQPHPEGRGAIHAMRGALEDARLAPEQVGYVNAHGTATVPNDLTESAAIRRVFGPHADELWVSSTKAATGHLLGGAGALEAIITLLAIERGALPPTLNLEEPGEGCDLRYVAKVARTRPLRAAMSNNFGFGGHNASLVFGATP
ncbi:MAG: beta-ketoacyl-[acyl-carrier-protein] synthase family protein [Kofleriaceae bacterium]